jgi:hypothetical protein
LAAPTRPIRQPTALRQRIHPVDRARVEPRVDVAGAESNELAELAEWDAMFFDEAPDEPGLDAETFGNLVCIEEMLDRRRRRCWFCGHVGVKAGSGQKRNTEPSSSETRAPATKTSIALRRVWPLHSSHKRPVESGSTM